MPSCDSCDRYLSPATVRPDGTCPSCGRAVQVAEHHEASDPRSETEAVPFPWHLKVATAALALYLGWRFWEGIVWLVGRVTS